jgi:hypothetical protein
MRIQNGVGCAKTSGGQTGIIGLGVKSGGFAPLLELSSDFKNDHELVLGFMLLFQPARKN